MKFTKNKIVRCDSGITPQKHYLKKILSLLLSIAMLFAITAGIDLSAYAATTQIYGGNSKASATNIEYSKEYALVMESGGTMWFKFTTNDTNDYWYNIFVNNVSVGNNNGFAGVSGIIYDYYDEQFAKATSFNSIGESGAKLESNTVYYIAIWGVREGTIKFHLDAAYDKYDDTKASFHGTQWQVQPFISCTSNRRTALTS